MQANAGKVHYLFAYVITDATFNSGIDDETFQMAADVKDLILDFRGKKPMERPRARSLPGGASDVIAAIDGKPATGKDSPEP
jgi:hypothetical protein